MGFPKKRLFLRAAFVFLLLLLIPYFLLMAAAGTKEFRSFAEAKVGEFLKADVHIGRIQVGLFNQIILSDFQLKQKAGTLPGIEVKQIIFRYSLKQLFTRNFSVPSAVILKAPKISMDQANLPAVFLQSGTMSSKDALISAFELAGGEIRYEIPALRFPILLRDIQAVLSPMDQGKMQGTFSAQLQGAIEGEISMRGEMDFQSGERHLTGEIQRASLNRGLIASKNHLSLRFRLDNHRITLETFTLDSPGKKIELSGHLNNIHEEPVLEASAKMTEAGRIESMEWRADFSTEGLTGKWMRPEGEINFGGKVTLKKRRLGLEDFKSNSGLKGEAVFDFDKGEGSISFYRGERRLRIFADRKHEALNLDIKADHLDVSGIDVVTSGRVRLSSDPFRPGGTIRLRGTFESDYVILDTLILQDFKGDFELDSQGLHEMNGSWGKHFKTSGSILWGKQPPEADLTVRVNSFDLKGVKKFANKPLPKDLGGILSGKMNVKGPLAQPRFIGRFTVNDGLLGRVDYEKAIIQFDGLAPSFKLIDSRVYRGRGTLLITGNVNLQAEHNIIHGVKFETQDHIVLYRGLDVSLVAEETDLDMEVHPGVKNLPAIGVKAGGRNPNNQEDGGGGEDRYLEVGPRFRF